MKSLTRLYLVGSLAVVSAIAVAAVPARANEPGYSLTLTGPSSAVVGKPFTMTASGTDPLDTNLPIPMVWAHYLNVDAIPTTTTTTCPTSYQTAEQLAVNTGGAIIAGALEESPPTSGGSFSLTIGYTPPAPAEMLICAYTEDGLTGTFAVTSLTMTFTSAPPARPTSPGAKPRNTKKPRVTRSDNTLTCNRGTWSHHPARFSYGWKVDGKARAGAHGAHLTITSTLRGHKVRCSVTASNAAGAATATSPSFLVR